MEIKVLCYKNYLCNKVDQRKRGLEEIRFKGKDEREGKVE